jgi:hypothetical protein
MDQRIESFLTDVLALAGEEPETVSQGVRRALGDCKAIFRAGQRYKHLRDQTALICRTLCRSRVVAEMHQRRGTRLAEHLKLVLAIIDRQMRGARTTLPAAMAVDDPDIKLGQDCFVARNSKYRALPGFLDRSLASADDSH